MNNVNRHVWMPIVWFVSALAAIVLFFTGLFWAIFHHPIFLLLIPLTGVLCCGFIFVVKTYFESVPYNEIPPFYQKITDL